MKQFLAVSLGSFILGLTCGCASVMRQNSEAKPIVSQEFVERARTADRRGLARLISNTCDGIIHESEEMALQDLEAEGVKFLLLFFPQTTID